MVHASEEALEVVRELLPSRVPGSGFGGQPARPGHVRLGMTLEPQLDSTTLYRAFVSWHIGFEA